jgi:two-component system nitrogen regulation sensor histidine kinase GlnL
MTEHTDHADIIDFFPHPVFVLDRESLRLRWLNDAAQNWVQSSLKSLKDQPLAHIIPGMGALDNEVQRVRENGHKISGEDLLVRARNGSEWRCAYNIFTRPADQLGPHDHMSDNRAVQNHICIFITPREKGSDVSSASSSSAVTMLGQMLAHELKNPLAGIGGAAQLLEAVLSDPDDLELTELIKTEVARIGRLANRMEEFGMSDMAEYEAFNIHTVLRKAALLFQAQDKNHVDIVENYDPSLPMVFGHEDGVMQIVINLIANASEALQSQDHPHGGTGRIELRTLYRAGITKKNKLGQVQSLPVEIRICDNGPGISADIRKSIFQPFVSTKANGQGLGLALVTKIIEDHGGVINILSEPGRTEFSILLPVDDGRK